MSNKPEGENEVGFSLNGEEPLTPESRVRSAEQKGKSWTKDPANDDVFIQAGEYGFIGKAISNYTIVFETEDELRDFYRFIRLLKKEYPEVRTIGTRIHKHLLAHAIGPLEAKHGKPKKESKKKVPVGHEPRDEVALPD